MLRHSAYFDNGHKFFLTKRNDYMYVEKIKLKNNPYGKFMFLGHLNYLNLNKYDM